MRGLLTFAALLAAGGLNAAHAPQHPSHATRNAVVPVPACPTNATVMDGWDDRAPPRRIFGNTYYIGTCGITSILIAGNQGVIVIDGATEMAAVPIEANIRALGFRLQDVKYLLNTHEHSDHAGGLAQLQRDTGAPLLALAVAATTLRSGKGNPADPQFENMHPYPPVADVRVITDGQVVQLGDLRLTAHATPRAAPAGRGAAARARIAWISSMRTVSARPPMHTIDAATTRQPSPRFVTALTWLRPCPATSC